MLDMYELGIDAYTPIAAFKGGKCAEGAKHMVLFQGQLFDQKDEYKDLRNYFLDFFRGETHESINLAAVDHVISITADDAAKIYLRVYTVQLKRSGTRLPRIELEEMGPSVNFTFRRSKPAAVHVMKEALKVPRTLKVILLLLYKCLYIFFCCCCCSPKRRRISRRMCSARPMAGSIWAART